MLHINGKYLIGISSYTKETLDYTESNLHIAQDTMTAIWEARSETQIFSCFRTKYWAVVAHTFVSSTLEAEVS